LSPELVRVIITLSRSPLNGSASLVPPYSDRKIIIIKSGWWEYSKDCIIPDKRQYFQIFQEMSRYENHIETGLGTKNGLFKVCPDF
jgi:hypothetical protein